MHIPITRRVVVTGAAGLIGRELCPSLRGLGYQVLELDASHGEDLSDERFVREYFRKHKADALVNLFAKNHHVIREGSQEPFLETSLESFDDYLHVNVTALFSVCREFIRNNERGSVINLSSIYGVVSPRPSLYGSGHKHPGYGASKAAVISLTQYLAVHAAPNFSINSVVLGGVLDDQPPHFVNGYVDKVPMGRMATVEDLFPVIEMLLRPDSRYMTGSTFFVDGGLTA